MHIRKKQRNQKNRKRQDKPMFGKILLMGGLILAMALIYATSQGRDEETESRPVSEPPDLNRIRGTHRALLQTIVAEDAEGLEMLAFFDRHARYGLLLPGGMLADIPTTAVGEAAPDGDPMNFTVVVASMNERTQNGITTVSPWEFEHVHALLFVPPDWSNQSDLAAGALFAHELRHAFDHAHHLQPVHATRREMIEGERRAYSLELRLLDQANQGRVGSAMDAILAGRTEWPVPPTTCLYMTDLRDEEKQRFINAMPNLVTDDLLPLMSLLPVGLNLRLAQRNGAGEAAEVTCLDRYLEHQARRSTF